jgi:hypothetical protein
LSSIALIQIIKLSLFVPFGTIKKWKISLMRFYQAKGLLNLISQRSIKSASGLAIPNNANGC